jgi:gliding motility-associated protein GldM
MSGGNCPETPRQKMIGMMYLFLTAMLALNVSGELLQAFDALDKGFNHSRETVERKNEVLYTEFKTANQNNPGKAGNAWQAATVIKAAADSLVNHIQDLKMNIVQKADGPEATPDNYTSISNQDIAAQVMITEDGGKNSEVLKGKLTDFKELLISYLDENDPADTTHIAAYNSVFNVGDIKGEKDVKKSWQSTKFEHVPLAASMAMLSKIQGDVRNAEADMVANIFSSIDKDSYKFDQIKSVVKPYKTTILEGETYAAELFMAAYDPNIVPKIEIDGVKLTNIVDGKGMLELKKPVGEYSWKGYIFMPSPDGSSDIPHEVSGEFQVVKPNAVISPIKMNVFYEGVDNPVAVSVPGVAGSNLDVRMTNVSTRRKGTDYIVKPNPGSAGKNSMVSVYANIEGKSKFIGKQEFRIKRVPDPVAVVAGKEGGKIVRNVLAAQAVVMAEMKDFDFELEYKVTGFNVSVLKNGFIQDARSNDNRFTEEQKELIKNTPRSSKVQIEDIRAKGPDGRTRNLGTLTFVLD